MSESVKAIPDGYHVVTPYLVVEGAAQAIEFYSRAFGAQELYRMPGPDGSVIHAEFRIGDSNVMIADASPQMGSKSPKELGGSPASLLLYVENVDAAFQQAVDAGATVVAPVADMFWGDRYGKVEDPFGHAWSLATHMEDLTPEQMAERMEAAFAQAPSD
jgi:uncharacterized glyoxalase superfamily protein PhnB